MLYRVTEDFYDLEDGQRRYRAGDEYPRAGLEPPPERVAALLSGKNRMRRPLIAEVGKPEKRPRRAAKKE